MLVPLLQYLTVAITQVIYHLHLYPSYSFHKRRFLRLTVRQSRVAEVTQWIEKLVESLRPVVSDGSLKSVSVVLLDRITEEPLERWGFVVRGLRKEWLDVSLPAEEFRESLATLLSWLEAQEAEYGSIYEEKDVTFTIVVETENTAEGREDSGAIDEEKWVELRAFGPDTRSSGDVKHVKSFDIGYDAELDDRLFELGLILFESAGKKKLLGDRG